MFHHHYAYSLKDRVRNERMMIIVTRKEYHKDPTTFRKEVENKKAYYFTKLEYENISQPDKEML